METWARAVLHDGKVELVDPIDAPEGARLVVTVVSEEDEEKAFWLAASLPMMHGIWDNSDDDIYAQLADE